MSKYDGWTLKSFYAREPFLVIGFFNLLRSDVIAEFERMWGKGSWKKERRKGHFELVKIKLIEVKEEI